MLEMDLACSLLHRRYGAGIGSQEVGKTILRDLAETPIVGADCDHIGCFSGAASYTECRPRLRDVELCTRLKRDIGVIFGAAREALKDIRVVLHLGRLLFEHLDNFAVGT